MDQPTNTPQEGGSKALFVILGVGLLAGILMAVLTITGNNAPRQTTANLPTPPPDYVRVGEMAPAFELETPDGEVVALEDYRGKVVAVNFWATWCVPCRDEMPALQEATETQDELVILGVNTGESRTRVANFMDELQLTFPALLDTDEEVADLYGVRAMPTTVWVDPEGIVRFEHFGPLGSRQIEQYVDTLLAEE